MPLSGSVEQLPPPEVRLVANRGDSQLWREYVDRYHYLGYTPLPGAQVRYLVSCQQQVVALLAFGAAAWKTAPRDRFIGWDTNQREARLHVLVNNARFLILPWIHIRNLASTVLACITARLAHDWHMRYAYRPVLVETFVESARFLGTCYKAANWIRVGKTQGHRGIPGKAGIQPFLRRPRGALPL